MYEFVKEEAGNKLELELYGLESLIDRCLAEDVGPGDITTNSIVPPGVRTTGYLVAKESGVLAGLKVAEKVFTRLDPGAEFIARLSDGATLSFGAVIAEIKAQARAILTGERLALNFLQRLSGIATCAARLSALAAEFGAVVVDTRKTTPGLRQLEKYAVRVGGARNHRFGLFDAVLIKDNHIKIAGSITAAVKAAKKFCPHTVKVEVEVEDLEGVREALAAGADIIMLDNMSVDEMRKAVSLVAGRVPLEASGGVTEEKIRLIAATGVNLISVGALTHSAKALDISLDIGEIKRRAN